MALLLVALSLAVFSPMLGNGFVDLDDYEYVVENPHVRSGLSPVNIRWSFTAFHLSNWHPLTWLSHMADAELFGLLPWGHHLTSLLLHGANTGLLFLVLFSMTGALWRSALVAALFGIHPVHVESVAWVAERKDVLSTFFWFLGLGAYVRYARRPGWGRYLAVAACLAVGLLAKPMPVTMPFLLLLLDWWPLSRGPFTAGSAGRLTLEKAPLLLLSAASSVVTYLAQQKGEAISSTIYFSMFRRLANAFLSYAAYLHKTVWPSGLAIYYPYPAVMPPAGLLIAFCLFTAGVVMIIVSFRRRPYLVSGWLWFLGTLVPVIGLVKIGEQAMADRYTYVPVTGLFIMAAWGVTDIGATRPFLKRSLAAAWVIAVAALSVTAFFQVGRWRDSRVLFSHTIAVTKDNWMAHSSLGAFLYYHGDYDGALQEFRESIRIQPLYDVAWNNVGAILVKSGLYAEGIEYYRRAIYLDPNYGAAHYNLAATLEYLRRYEEALNHFERARKLNFHPAEAQEHMRNILSQSGKANEPPIRGR